MTLDITDPLNNRPAPFVAVCCERGCEQDALTLAVRLRRAGVPCETRLRGKRQFDKAKAAGASNIVTVGPDETRYWSRFDNRSVALTVDEVVSYEGWLADDSNTLPDPVDVLLKMRAAGFAVARWVEELAA